MAHINGRATSNDEADQGDTPIESQATLMPSPGPVVSQMHSIPPGKRPARFRESNAKVISQRGKPGLQNGPASIV